MSEPISRPPDDFWRTDVLFAIESGCSRDEVAVEYATCLRAYGPTGDWWTEIHAAILARWSPAALRYIKEKAWKLARA